MKRRSWALMAAVVSIWGFNWTVMKVGLNFVSPLNLISQRLLLASIALSPILILERKKIPRDANTWLKLIFNSIVNATGMASTHIGLLYETSGLSSILTYTQPLFVFCLAALFLNEKITMIRVLGAALGFLGVVIIYMERVSQITLSSATLFLIAGAFLWAVTTIYYKKFLTHVNPEIVNVVQFPIGTVFLITVTSMLDKLTFSVDIAYILSILYIAILGSAVASTIWLALIRIEEATIVSMSSLAVPAAALFFGWIFLKEPVRPSLLLGFALILTGIYLVNKHQKIK